MMGKKSSKKKELRAPDLVTKEQWLQLYVAQKGRCPICRKMLKHPLGTVGKRAAVDHDHKTGKVRGLLCCYPCNYILGMYRDNIEMLANSASYLVHPPAQEVLYKEPMNGPGK